MKGNSMRQLALLVLTVLLVIVGSSCFAFTKYHEQQWHAFVAAEKYNTKNTLLGKSIIGYQGWFTCPGDAIGSKGWDHWVTSHGGLAVEMLPRVEWPEEANCNAQFVKGSRPVQLYSAADPQITKLHVSQIKRAGYQAIALQRFVSNLSNPTDRKRVDAVLMNMHLEASKQGEHIVIWYDISGANPETWVEAIKNDWSMINASEMMHDGTYQMHRARPVIAIWGLGVANRAATPEQAAALIDWLRHDPRAGSPTILGGVPLLWTLQSNWRSVYMSLDIISPWSVSTYKDKEGIKQYVRRTLNSDILLTRSHRIDYMPVVFPGFSTYNLSEGNPGYMQAPRLCGSFYYEQIKEFREAGVNMLFAAMFDEYNEGTALADLASVVPPNNHLIPSLDGQCEIGDGDLRAMIRNLDR